MVRKKIEGDEQERRGRARRARAAGREPGGTQATTGSSKQRHHVSASARHDEKLDAVHRGKRQLGERPRPLQHTEHDTGAGEPVGSPAVPAPEVRHTEAGVALDAEQTRVYQAVADLLVHDEDTFLPRVAAAADRSQDRTRRILAALTRANVVRAVPDGADDLGTRYEIA